MKIHYPFPSPKKYPLTQLFGVKFMYRGEIVTHKGIDYGLPKWTSVLAPFDGEVVRVEKTRDYGYGRTVYIKSKQEAMGGFFYEALLAHLEEIKVRKGDKVKTGDRVGRSGRTGFWRGKNGYHLHFGLKFGGKYVDPLPYLTDKDPLQKDIFKDDSRLKCFLGDHTVKKGDTLWNIAEKFYGSGGHYNEIFIANQDILKGPHEIYPGQVLRIPVLVNRGI